ncbi:hypothetical protein FJZ18_02175 [Candidatus Pacearchaeota archaeon]|nr:hypothetical protein [Candidatus Pacearchaeota archaeon]
MISPTLKKIVEEELKGADIATKIARVSSDYIDEAIQQNPLRLPVKEVWRKTFPRTKEEIEEYNLEQKWFAIRNQSYRYEHGGNNILELAIVPYEGSIPNGQIQIPHDIFAPHPRGQMQMVLGEEGIIFRELQDLRPFGKIRALNQTVLGRMVNLSTSSLSRSYEGILKSVLKDFFREPNNFMHDFWSSKYNDDDHYFPIVALVPENHLSLDNWWNKNERQFIGSAYSKKEDWNHKPLIYATILRPELEKQGYVIEARK